MTDSNTPALLLERIPQQLHETAAVYWQRWLDACEEHGVAADLEAALDIADLGFVFSCSDYVARTAIRAPGVLLELLQQDINGPMTHGHYADELNAVLETCSLDDMTALRRAFRLFRHRHTLRIALRDLQQLADIETLLHEQSELAAAIIDAAVATLHRRLQQTLGSPRDAEGREQRLIVLAMGKLGGFELNFSSDIDLIFCYPEDGRADGRGSLSNQEFFIRLIRELVPLLDDITEDSFVYRVDTRLRPYGASGPLVMNFNAVESYYQTQGREWERYAMIKARAVSGRREDIEQLTQILRPFVYRRYLDYSVFAGIRDMKAMIETQVRRKSMQGNIKLGAGGIREIEFIGQTFQLVRGGRDGRLQTAGLLKILQRLGEQGTLEQADVDDLVAAYRYLRRLENRIQIIADQQKHELPRDELSQQRLSLAMRCSDWEELLANTRIHTDNVSRLFDELINEQIPEDAASAELDTVILNYLAGALEYRDSLRDSLRESLVAQGIRISDEEFRALDEFSASGAFQNTSADTRAQCARLLAAILTEIEDEHASFTLKRLLDIMRAVLGRPVYLAMMAQYPVLHRRLLWLCQSGEWFTEQMRVMPMLLDELIEGDIEHSLPTREQLAVELESKISAVPGDDAELILDSLRVFKQSNVFRVAMLDVIGEHEVADLSDRLSDIAELLIDKTLKLAWAGIARRHGEPACEVDGERRRPGIAVIGYGKLGGAELGYGSDLDVVFVHDSRGDGQVTDGDRQLDNSAFFARVVQRFLHLMGTRTFSGVLYEIDTRLRPDGGAGLMVSSTDAFGRYQQERAWTWEHQALVRARAVAGDPNTVAEFARIRSSVLSRKRDWPALAADVVEMRNRMREHLASKRGESSLKQDAGGLVDIEFIAQAGVLLLAAEEPALLGTTATLQLLSGLGRTGWLTESEVDLLTHAYMALRRAHNYRSLGVEDTALEQRCSELMPRVSAVWDRLFQEYETAAG